MVYSVIKIQKIMAKTITADELKKHRDDYVLIDVREAEEGQRRAEPAEGHAESAA